MNLRRRTLLAALGLTPLYGFAQARQFAPGVDYTVLEVPRPIEVPGKIEALEFFWYGCPHCYAFEPTLERWVAHLPADVNFRRVPAVLNEGWDREAAVFYAFEALGVLERLHRPFFDAIHRERLNTRDPAVMGDWLKQHGVDPKRYQDAYKSFGVQSKVRRVAQVSRDYHIEGTPELAVNGRYTISVEQGHSASGMLEVADYLIGVERKRGAASR
jgi:protein dithiol oxidoreductase (disulfide-forming)